MIFTVQTNNFSMFNSGPFAILFACFLVYLYFSGVYFFVKFSLAKIKNSIIRNIARNILILMLILPNSFISPNRDKFGHYHYNNGEVFTIALIGCLDLLIIIAGYILKYKQRARGINGEQEKRGGTSWCGQARSHILAGANPAPEGLATHRVASPWINGGNPCG